ncbi:MAG TPA: PilZ domain-containing protein [Bacteriovoracaceae bacterium]|nr:PilZ domain-containing protein [Bacteriovoracaceae bacterium]
MSQTFFSKQTPDERASRFNQLATLKETIVVWKKGSAQRYKFQATHFDKKLNELVVDNGDIIFETQAKLLGTFELRGMNFFCELTVVKSSQGYTLFKLADILYKSERRSSYRLLTYPIYEIYALFHIDHLVEDSSVINLNTGVSRKNLFKSYLKLVDKGDSENQYVKVRVQDLSATGLALHISELEEKFIVKDQVYKNLEIHFPDEVIVIPEAKVVYVVPYISDKGKKFKVGVNFPNLSSKIDNHLGRKINELLRQIDSNKDFENFI